MKHKTIYSAVLSGAVGLGALGFFHTPARALDLSDFTGPDQRVITQDAPRAGGAVLVREDVIEPAMQVPAAQLPREPVLQQVQPQAQVLTRPQTLTPSLTTASAPTNAAALNAYAPAAGGRSDGSTGRPGVGIDNSVDVTTAPGNAFDRFSARFNAPGTASAPVDGAIVNRAAATSRVEDSFNAITPAAGDTGVEAAGRTQNATLTGGTGASVRDSIQIQTQGQRASQTLFNN